MSTQTTDAASAAGARRGQRFRYESCRADPVRGLLICQYSVDGRPFEERITFPPASLTDVTNSENPTGPADSAAPAGLTGPPSRWDRPAVAAAARLVFLLAGVSAYKTAAPPVIDTGEIALTRRERAFLRDFYLNGLGEFAYRNGLDLSGLRIEGPSAPDAPRTAEAARVPVPEPPGVRRARALVPFGGGIDSIVTVEMVRRRADVALFVVSRPGDRFDAIERPAAVTGLPVVRADREIDPQLLRSRELGFLNGHVPVTGILSAIAVMAAALDGRDAVVMSNEWSASVPTVQAGDRAVNHQYSKSAEFEAAFRGVLAETSARLPAGAALPDYFSALRPRTELWIAERFARLTPYHGTFRSCNRAFHIDKAKRLDHWCGQCDKCCFIDLILAPFLPATELGAIFGGREPLADSSLAGRFRALLGDADLSKPFECVGEVNECRAALLLADERDDRVGFPLLHELATEVRALPGRPSSEGLWQPVGEHFIPAPYAEELLA
jgi:UDP-N-acetyl-alpha-D-muramoyl-L-alanyl-L-glutamate epimerase